MQFKFEILTFFWECFNFVARFNSQKIKTHSNMWFALKIIISMSSKEFLLLLQLLAFCAFVAVAQAGLVSHGHAIAPAHYAAAPVHYAPGWRNLFSDSRFWEKYLKISWTILNVLLFFYFSCTCSSSICQGCPPSRRWLRSKPTIQLRLWCPRSFDWWLKISTWITSRRCCSWLILIGWCWW